MQDVVTTLSGGHPHFIMKERLLWLGWLLSFARPLNVQQGCETQFNTAPPPLTLSYNPFLWLSDLWPQLKKTPYRLTFTGNKINSRLAPWDKVLLFSGISSLCPGYQITFNASKLSMVYLTLLWLGYLAGGTAKIGRTEDKLVLFSVAGCLTPACNEEMTNKRWRMGNLSSN